MAQEHKTLLNFVGLLDQAYEGGRPKPFNLFSVLRTAHDEVNLHSRFLHALLDHRDHRTKSRENLRDFAQSVLKIHSQFDWTNSEVQRETYDIDILITLGTRVAIVIENKIFDPGREGQLYKYWKRMKSEGFGDIRLVYVTLYGRLPPKKSTDRLSQEIVIRVGYNSKPFRDWLSNCQQRAFDEPELRESIVQYLWLVQELTGTDPKGGYMDALKELLKEGNNLRSADDIARAIPEAKIDLELDLWKRMKKEIMKRSGLEFEDDGYYRNTLEEAVVHYFHGYRNRLYYGIRCDLPGYKTLCLRVSREDEGGVPHIYYGVSRNDRPTSQEAPEQTEFEAEYHRLKKLLEEDPATRCECSKWWPCFQLPATSVPEPSKSSREEYDKEVEQFIQEIAIGIEQIDMALSAET